MTAKETKQRNYIWIGVITIGWIIAIVCNLPKTPLSKFMVKDNYLPDHTDTTYMHVMAYGNDVSYFQSVPTVYYKNDNDTLIAVPDGDSYHLRFVDTPSKPMQICTTNVRFSQLSRYYHSDFHPILNHSQIPNHIKR